MKELNDIIARFDSISDLPVPEEMLGAYLEDNLSEQEDAYIRSMLSFNDELSDLAADIDSEDFSDFDSDFDTDIDGMADNNFFDGGAIESPDFSVFNIENFENIDPQISTTMTDNNNHIDEASLSASAAARIFGEEGNGSDPVSDPLIYQGNEGVCAIRSQQIILRDYGIDIPLEDLKQFAIQNGWYDPSGDGGTPVACVGALLDACGVGVRQEVNCTVYDLINELSQGHRVIVGVDADELWADRDDSMIDQAKTWLDDVFGNEEANHALIVAGVEVNPDDPEDVKVILTDPGTGDLRIEYSLDEFMDAWEDSNCFMTTTTSPAPYQYDPVHGCEVPSNFAVDQFITENSLPLNADVRGVEMPEDYAAYYDEGHLDVVGTDANGQDVTFEKFQNEFSKFKQPGGMAGAMGQDHFDKDQFMHSLKSLFGIADDVAPSDLINDHANNHVNNPKVHVDNIVSTDDGTDIDGGDDGGDDDDDDDDDNDGFIG